MIGFGRGCVVGLGFLALTPVSPAAAQENLDLGKTPAQLYASDCAICHKTPQGLTRGGGLFGLSSFLREHYTASRESAAVIAAYVQSMDRGPPAAAKRPATKRTAKGDEKGKPGKPGEVKPEQMKSGEPKSAEPKAGEAKAGDAKPGDGKPSEAKASEPKSSDSKPSEPKSNDSKPAAAKDEKSEKKSD
jgi:hypothetical protein